MAKSKVDSLADLAAEVLAEQVLRVRLVIHHQDPGGRRDG
jgi:hypothetical protein